MNLILRPQFLLKFALEFCQSFVIELIDTFEHSSVNQYQVNPFWFNVNLSRLSTPISMAATALGFFSVDLSGLSYTTSITYCFRLGTLLTQAIFCPWVGNSISAFESLIFPLVRLSLLISLIAQTNKFLPLILIFIFWQFWSAYKLIGVFFIGFISC